MTNYLDQNVDEKINEFAKKQTEKFKAPPETVKQILDSMDRIRERKKKYKETFYSSRERNPDDE